MLSKHTKFKIFSFITISYCFLLFVFGGCHKAMVKKNFSKSYGCPKEKVSVKKIYGSSTYTGTTSQYNKTFTVSGCGVYVEKLNMYGSGSYYKTCNAGSCTEYSSHSSGGSSSVPQYNEFYMTEEDRKIKWEDATLLINILTKEIDKKIKNEKSNNLSYENSETLKKIYIGEKCNKEHINYSFISTYKISVDISYPYIISYDRKYKISYCEKTFLGSCQGENSNIKCKM